MRRSPRRVASHDCCDFGENRLYRLNRIESLLERLTVLDAADGGAFPYADCRRLQSRADRYAALIADLDGYVAELAGYRSSVSGAGQWTEETVAEVQRRLGASFFVRFPAYAEHRAEMTASDVPALRWTLDVAEGTRLILLELISLLRSKRPTIG
jgi:hypothetical protein